MTADQITRRLKGLANYNRAEANQQYAKHTTGYRVRQRDADMFEAVASLLDTLRTIGSLATICREPFDSDSDVKEIRGTGWKAPGE